MGMTDLVAYVRSAPSRLARRTSGVYRREIDGLRFFAIFIVLIGHLCERSQRFATTAVGPGDVISQTFYYFFQRPGVGVELFFMISGFVIFSPLAGKPRQAITGGFVGNYFKRRLLRIEPPYILLLVVTYLVVVGTGYVPPESHRFYEAPKSITTSLFASLAYSHGWLFGTAPRLLPPGWSLEIEIQFYTLAPLIFFLYLSVGNRRVRAWLGAVVLALSLALAGAVQTGASAPHWEFTLLNFFPLFWAGIMFCDFEADLRAIAHRAPKALAGAVGWLGLLILIAVPSVAPTSLAPKALQVAAMTSGCFLMFLGILRAESNWFYRFCASGWPSLVGSACYSLYLVHLQTMQVCDSLLARVLPAAIVDSPLAYFAVSVVIVLPLSIAGGLVFYSFVERTFMLKDWPSRFADVARRFLASVGQLRSVNRVAVDDEPV